MKIPFRQLGRHLSDDLARVYLVAGDEHLLVAEALEEIRAAALRGGFDSRELHVVERSFRWGDLEAGADNLSLFAARRVVELRLPSPRPGDAGARTIRRLAEKSDPDRLLIVAVAGKLDAAAARSAWVKSIEKHGVRVDVWPVDRAELPRWIQRRAAGLRLELSADAAQLLADRIEGNLLAADQELRKLALTCGQGEIDEARVLDSVADSARFDVFLLADAVLAGDVSRAIKVLRGLQAEGVQPVRLAFALSRELALVARIKFAVTHGETLDDALARRGVWYRRQPVIRRAVQRFGWSDLSALLARAAQTDRAIKGGADAQPWEALTELVIAALGPRAGRI